MRRTVIRTLVCFSIFALGGCDYRGWRGGHREGDNTHQDCRKFTSCGECTPVLGCGWCTYGQGQGACLADPDDCNVQQFSWTWETAGCPAAADSGIVPGDAATAGNDASATGGDAAVSPDGAVTDAATD